MSKRLTVQLMANLCNFAWEVEKTFGFHCSSVTEFKRYVIDTPQEELYQAMTNLLELLHTIREIGDTEFGVPVEPLPPPPPVMPEALLSRFSGGFEKLNGNHDPEKNPEPLPVTEGESKPSE